MIIKDCQLANGKVPEYHPPKRDKYITDENTTKHTRLRSNHV